MRDMNNIWLRWTTRVLIIAVLALSSGVPMARATVLPAATPIQVRVVESVSSATSSSGQPITGQVVNDVVINGVVVIKANATATGRVTNVTKPSIAGTPGSITIKFETVQAASGTNVPLVNSMFTMTGESKVTGAITMGILGLICLPCLLGVLIKGGDAQIATGTVVSAMSESEVTIN